MKTNPFIRNRRERLRAYKWILPILMFFNIAFTIGVSMGYPKYYLLTWLVTLVVVLVNISDKRHIN